jgi:biotin transport system substrate-specific component
MTTLAIHLAPARTKTTARLTFHVGCVLAGSFLVAALAQLSFKLPFTPVPITGQTLGVLLVGAAYGPALGAVTLAVYLAWGIIGLPVFAPVDGVHDTGLDVLAATSASGGYLVGFVAAAGLVGWLSRRGWDRSFGSAIGAMLLGEVVIYAFGLAWLHRALPHLTGGAVTLDETLAAGLYPFVVGDVLKMLAAAALLPGAWFVLRRLAPQED